MRRVSIQAESLASLLIETVTTEPDRLLIVARPTAPDGACPECGTRSSKVHSRYDRQLRDLPSHGRAVHLRIQVRRFRCAVIGCPRLIFGEPLADSIAPRAARRTARLEGVVHHLGIALGGRPAASLARRLMLPVSRDTLLRVLRRRAPALAGSVRVIGIDDFAWKRGQRYGTVVCDLEQRCIVDLLPDREPATVAAWLAAHPDIAVVSRDHGAGYGQAASKGAPQAVQVMKAIRQALGSTVIDPALLTCAERIQYEGFLRRQEDSKGIKALAAAGKSMREITRLTRRSRKLVRSVLRGGDGDVFRCRQSMLEPYIGTLRAEWEADCRNGAELWRRLRAAGFRGGLRVVTEWTTRQRRSEKADVLLAGKVPPARLLSRLMTTQRRQLAKIDAVTVAAIETGVPALAIARDLMERFHCILRARDIGALPHWLAETGNSMLASFGKGIAADLAAVKAALIEPWSNGQTEGQITKLKLVKRQMYGRAHLDLLRARLLVSV
jgi:transposase